ncbi:winged helix-turn-helix domain-containing protein [Sphingopyxis sp. 113P3]|uniref:winged helix-turn-helix domain-containing protein n=1 Tax=Sphingopyxis sp. (strain 113P3) TaxID=292913 RepID=UPI0009FB4F28|nr:winged helix-turn-helix domain-containing protein [Sphingopyxis sp. 113P3]
MQSPMRGERDDCRLWRFGNIEYDEAIGELIVAGQVVELDRSSRVVLARLLAGDGTSVDKEELLKAGWPGRKVHENSLTKAIGRLRQALGDDGWRIEAVYGHGYRFVSDAADVAYPRPDPPPLRRRRHFTIALAVIAGACAFASIYAHRTAPTEQPLKIGEAPDVIGRILWVDDHPENNVEEKRFLEGQRMAVYNVTSSDDALKLLAMYRYDAVISDMGRNGNPLAGLDLVKAMRARGDHTPFYLYTILPSRAQRDLLAQHGGQGVAVTSEGLYSFLLPAGADR